jgi:signal transduction histidine kinase/ActR/RegA family two-component response regulator
MRSVDLHLVTGGASLEAPPGGRDPGEGVPAGPGHTVQFYENETFLAAAVADFVGDGILAGEPAIVLATEAHRRAFGRRLRAKGIDAEAARHDGLLTWCDADAMLARIMDGGVPDEGRFRAEVVPLLERAELRRQGASVRAYGELVDVLWQRGETTAALRLEELWNELATTHRFALLCGYAMGPFYGVAGGAHREAVCGHHTHVVPLPEPSLPAVPPAASAPALPVAADDDAPVERDMLRRHARALAAEVAQRRQLEQQLRVALAERRATERELRRSRALLEQAQRVAGLGSFSVVPETGDAEWSEGLWRLLGLSPRAGAPSLERLLASVHEDDVPAVRAMLRRAAAGAASGAEPLPADEIRLRAPDGSMRRCELRMAATAGTPDEPPTVHGTLVEVTDRRAREAERRALDARLLDTQRLETLGVLAGGIAHDFNNLLTSILGNADLLQSALPDGPERVMVSEILLAGRRSADLTRQLLAYAGHASYVVRALDLSALVAEVGALLRTAMPAGGTLQLDVPDGALVTGDRAQLTQVLMNLVTNAAEALPSEGGTVTVRVRTLTIGARESARLTDACASVGAMPVGRAVRLEVSDTGHGMTREVRGRMFEPFFTTKHTGRGLGLAATMGIVRAHGGALSVVSARHQGTTVRVWLPAAPGDAAAEGPRADDAARAPRSAASPRILVVDDDPAVRGTLARMLGRLRYDVVQAGGAREALAALDAGDAPALAIVDFTMPETSGQETAVRLQERCPGLRVLFTSGYADAEAPDGAAGLPELGDGPLLPKPYDIRTLERLVGGALRAAEEAAPVG